MKSLKELFRIGTGTSSSHTMAPRRAARNFLEKYPKCDTFRVTLYSCLAATGKGHLSEKAIREAMPDKHVEIDFQANKKLPHHPNGIRFEVLGPTGAIIGIYDTYSIGGGALLDDKASNDIYNLKTMLEILEYCQKTGKSFWEYVEDCEGEHIHAFLKIYGRQCAIQLKME